MTVPLQEHEADAKADVLANTWGLVISANTQGSLCIHAVSPEHTRCIDLDEETLLPTKLREHV